jgi:hypothetical protein
VALEEQKKKVLEKSETARSARSQGATFTKNGVVAPKMAAVGK